MALAELMVGIAHGSFQSPHKPRVGVASTSLREAAPTTKQSSVTTVGIAQVFS